MKFLIDNNLSFKLVQPLQTHFPGTTHVSNVLSTHESDDSIWAYAQRHGYIILTKDNDFDERSQLAGCPPKIVHLLCGNKTTLHILHLLLSHIAELLHFGEADPDNCLLKIAV
jgi:predicted nuclease of predicted toxin-antitoxin system